MMKLKAQCDFKIPTVELFQLIETYASQSQLENMRNDS